MDEAYANAETEYIQGKIDRISHQHINKQHTTAWETINDLTGRKSKPSIRVKLRSWATEKKSSWFTHFQKLLGGAPTTAEEQELPKIKIANALNISIEPFQLKRAPERCQVHKDTKVSWSRQNPGTYLDRKDPIFHDL